MTCSKACRLRRRAKQEKARRASNLPEARAAERVRQREYRRQQAKTPKMRPMSQAGLHVQLGEVIGEFMAHVEQQQRLSQAGLRRRLQRLAQLGRGETAGTSPEIGT